MEKDKEIADNVWFCYKSEILACAREGTNTPTDKVRLLGGCLGKSWDDMVKDIADMQQEMEGDKNLYGEEKDYKA